jgi:hypothetical protein
MLREISASIEEIRVRRVLWVLGAVISVVLVPGALLGLAIGSEDAARGGAESQESLVIAVLGFMAIVGIAGAWARLFLTNLRLGRSPWLRSAVASSIAAGILCALIMMVEAGANTMAVLLGTVAAIGIYLFCATIGAKNDAI